MLISMKLNIFELFMLSHVHFAVSAVGVRQKVSVLRDVNMHCVKCRYCLIKFFFHLWQHISSI